MYLFDTDTLSVLLRSADYNQALRDRFRDTHLASRHISAITVAELRYGAQRLAPSRRRDALFADISSVLGELIVLPFDERAAETFAQIKAEMERHGQPRADADLMIASVALANGLIVVTGNTAHFGAIPGIRIENWIR